MKSKVSLFVLITFFILTNLAFAGSPLHFSPAKNSANVELPKAVTVAGTTVPAGQYKVSWEGTGSDVKVTFFDGKKAVATAPARLTDGKDSVYTGHYYPAVETSLQPDNTHVLRAIDLKNASLQFGGSATAEAN